MSLSKIQQNFLVPFGDARRDEILKQIHDFARANKIGVGTQFVQINAEQSGNLLSLRAPSYAVSKRLKDFVRGFDRAYLSDLKGVNG